MDLRQELVNNIRYAIQQKYIRDTGRDVECWVESDFSAVHGIIRERDQITRFTIPVVVMQEYTGPVVASTHRGSFDEEPRRVQDIPQA